MDNKAKINFGLHNKFEVKVFDKDGNLTQKASAYNTVCKGWYDVIKYGCTYTYSPYASDALEAPYLAIGDGSGVPSVNDTALFNQTRFLPYTSDGMPSISAQLERNSLRFSKEKKELSTSFQQIWDSADDAGMIMTELGLEAIFFSSRETYLMNHAVLTDENGNAVSIKKTEDNTIFVFCTIYLSWADIDDPYIELTGFPDTPLDIDDYKSGSNTYLYNHHSGGITSLLWMILRSTSSESGNRMFALFTHNPERVYNAEPYHTYWEPDVPWNALMSCSENGKTISCTFPKIPKSVLNNFDPLYLLITPCNVGSTRSVSILVDVRKFGAFRIIGEVIGTGDGTTTEFETKHSLPKNAKVYVNGELSDAEVKYYPISGTFASEYFFKISGESTPGNIIETHDGYCNITSAGSIGPSFPDGYYGLYTQYFGNLEKGTNYYWNKYELPVYYLNIVGNLQVYGSFDMVNWTPIANHASTQSYTFFKTVANSMDTTNRVNTRTPSETRKNVIFQTPPPSGAEIKIDYDCDCLPIDDTKEFDLSIEITINGG